MRIGIDISQMAYEGTGVANFLQNLVETLIKHDRVNSYVLFGSSLRNRRMYQVARSKYKDYKNVSFKIYNFPPTLLDLLWNTLHLFPIEWLIGDVDIFISSDWTQPPTKNAKKATILYDLIVYTYPEETAKQIVAVQKRRLGWVKKEVDTILCISQSTKKDAMKILHIPENRLSVIYPGI